MFTKRAGIYAVAIMSMAACELPTEMPPSDKLARDARSHALPASLTVALFTAYKSPGIFVAEYYGNWCGPNWSGAGGVLAPIDKLDTACKTHDKAFAAADTKWTTKYKKAKNASERKTYCTSWRNDYKAANTALSLAASRLPDRNTLASSMKRGDTPDVWGYDSRIYGPHPYTATKRFNYAVGTIALTWAFKDPPCSSK
jgi:hypothetical protein